MPSAEVLRCLEDARVHKPSVKARNRKGDYHPLGLLLLPGELHVKAKLGLDGTPKARSAAGAWRARRPC